MTNAQGWIFVVEIGVIAAVYPFWPSRMGRFTGCPAGIQTPVFIKVRSTGGTSTCRRRMA